jgi:chromosome segregation ATPase
MSIFTRIVSVAQSATTTVLDHAQTDSQKQQSRADELHNVLAGLEKLIHGEEAELGRLQAQEQGFVAELTAAQDHLHSIQDAVDADPSKWSDADRDAIDKAVGPVDEADKKLTELRASIAASQKTLHDHLEDFKREKAACDAEYAKVGHIHDDETAAAIEHQSAKFGEKQDELKRKLAEGNDPTAHAQGELAAARGEHAQHGGLNDTERKVEENEEAKRRAALLAKYGRPAAAPAAAAAPASTDGAK